MAPLPPPIGESDKITARRGLEGISVLLLLVGVPVVAVGGGSVFITPCLIVLVILVIPASIGGIVYVVTSSLCWLLFTSPFWCMRQVRSTCTKRQGCQQADDQPDASGEADVGNNTIGEADDPTEIKLDNVIGETDERNNAIGEADNQHNATGQADDQNNADGKSENISDIIYKAISTGAILTPLFSTVTKRSTSQRTDSTAITKDEYILLFADKKEPESSAWKVWTHIYFLSMAFLALFWFVVVFVDNFWYQKLSTCNDINVNVTQFQCYAITEKKLEFDPVDCLNQTAEEKSSPIICYIQFSSPSTALGIATGIAKLLVFIADSAFRISHWLGDREWGRVVLVAAQVIGILFPFFFVIPISVIQAGVGINPSLFSWYLYGFVPTRIFSFALTAVTVPIAVMVPWWAFKGKPDYKDVDRLGQCASRQHQAAVDLVNPAYQSHA